MQDRAYNTFESVEEFRSYYGLTQINEKKDPEPAKEDPNLKDSRRALTDDIEVVYADQSIISNIFKHIIVFTNDRDPENNKTLHNIYDAVEAIKKAGCEIVPEVHVFVAAKMDSDEDESEIYITDGHEEMTISDESNVDTLIFSRLGVQDEDECEHIVKLLQDRGFLVLNPVAVSALACDKYQTALLLQKGDIPQPNFTLMTKQILYDEEKYFDAMKEIYKDWDEKDPDKNKDKDVIIKILDGHGGTGVAKSDGKSLYAILQLIFAVDPEISLLLQKKEEADGGDIRVHVLTLRDRQVILAAMKRVKIGGDFRSNVSLGASAEPIKLTPEQEQIALKAATLSKLPWCAVDIMPLVKGSNPEIGDNVVLELNASPGSAGISEVIKHNFINVLISELDNPSDFMLQDKTAGFIESVTIDFGPVQKDYLAKLDTGNSTKASALEVGEFEDKDGKITFTVDGTKLSFNKVTDVIAGVGDNKYRRPVIEIPELKLGLRKLRNVHIAVVKSRANKSTNLLLNRDVLSKLGYVVHPNMTHLLTAEMERVKII